MTTNLKRLPGDAIIKQIEKQLGVYDRSPFHEQLARALACGPSKTAWQRMATRAPDKWARSVRELAIVSGFAERQERVITHKDPKLIAEELVARYGREQADQMLRNHGLNLDACLGQTKEPIEGECSPA